MIGWILDKIPGRILVIAIAVLMALLGASTGANWLLLKSRDAAIANAAKWEEAHKTAQAAAKSCSDGVDGLVKEANERAQAAEKRAAEADKAARASETKSQRTLATGPSVAGNACASMLALSRQKIAERKKL